MQIEKTSEDQARRLLATHPGLLDEESASMQERSHVVHCMQCALQFQVDIAPLKQEDRGAKNAEEIMHIRYHQPESNEQVDVLASSAQQPLGKEDEHVSFQRTC